MKRIVIALVFLNLTAFSSLAHNSVVVVPLITAKRLGNVVTVSHSGGDFTDPIAAVASITDASFTNPYVVMIGPGLYTLNQTLEMANPQPTSPPTLPSQTSKRIQTTQCTNGMISLSTQQTPTSKSLSGLTSKDLIQETNLRSPLSKPK